jgi:carboxymethylenebutenolidase
MEDYFLAKPETPGKYPGLIIIHEIWGLKDHIKDVATRFSREGFVAIAPNFFSDIKFEEHVDQSILGEMQDPEKRDEAQKKMRTAFAPIQAPSFAEVMITKLEKTIDILLNDPSANGQFACVGFCFGGTYTFSLATREPRLKAAVPFYGHPPALEQITNISCPVLAFYGEHDTNLTQGLPELKEAFAKYSKPFEAIVYPNCGHAFFNDTNPRTYNFPAALDAWERTLTFLHKNLS